MTELRNTLVAVVLCTACALAACGRKGVVHIEVSELPRAMQADYLVFADNCGKCHGLARPLNAPIRDVHHWDTYVMKMMRTPGSGISAREIPAILRFLYYYTRTRLASAERDDAVPSDLPVAESPDESAPGRAVADDIEVELPSELPTTHQSAEGTP